MSDEELLGRYRSSGDTEWLGVLYDRYLHLVYGLCLKYLKSREDGQDAVMNIFEALTEKLLTYEVMHFKSWLYTVAKNHCLMELRKRKGNVDGFFMENEPALHLNEEEKDMDNDLEALEDCLKGLKEDQQQCVRLFYLQQKSYNEIAQDTSFTVKKVKSYIQNGKRNLKLCLERKNVKG